MILPTEFLREGDVRLSNIEAYYTDYSIVGIQFIFRNGEKEATTELFGLSQSSNGKVTTKKYITIEEQITSVSHLAVNTQLSPDEPENSGWYVVNF